MIYGYVRINTAVFPIDGEKVKLRVVRDSKICRLISGDDSIIIGNTIYVRDRLLTQKVLRKALNRIEQRPKWLHKLWNLFGK